METQGKEIQRGLGTFQYLEVVRGRRRRCLGACDSRKGKGRRTAEALRPAASAREALTPGAEGVKGVPAM